MSTDTRTRLSTDQQMQVLALMARGDTNSSIIDQLFKEYKITVSPQRMSQLRKEHKDVIDTIKNKMLERQVSDAEAVLKKSRRMLFKTVDRAEKDDDAYQELRRQLHDGEIDAEEYDRRRQDLMTLSVQELLSISKEMFAQTEKPIGDGSLPPGGNNSIGNTEALIQAIQSSDEVTLQQLVFKSTGGSNAQSQPVQG